MLDLHQTVRSDLLELVVVIWMLVGVADRDAHPEIEALLVAADLEGH